jgi:hypothetical protein
MPRKKGRKGGRKATVMTQMAPPFGKGRSKRGGKGRR